jgi:hypothetical protein
MKKTVLLICISFVSTLTFSQDTVWRSLNGYHKALATKMTLPFQNLGHQPRQITSVWFDKPMVENMIALLNSEKTINHPTDGVRIYFAIDATGGETVVLVSTYDSKTHNQLSDEQANYHTDYWVHSNSAPLFNMTTSINGTPSHYTDKPGTLLYTKSNLLDEVSCDPDNPHYLSRSLCEDMVIGYVKQRIKINTRSEWFDIDMINGFTKIFQNGNIDGIRIYFALNPVENPYTLYPGKDTFVIVPTKLSDTDSNVHIDYFDCSLASDYFIKSPFTLKKLLKIAQKKHALKSFKKSKKKMLTGPYVGQDNGQLCPFNCN